MLDWHWTPKWYLDRHLNEDVKGGSATLAWLQRPQQGVLVNDTPSGTIDHLHALLAFTKCRVVQ